MKGFNSKSVVLFFILASIKPGLLQQSDCPMVQESDLGGVDSPSTSGLISDALRANLGDNPPPISLQVFNSTVVCIAQGSVQNKTRMVSVIARFVRTDDNMVRTLQFQWQCINGQWGTNILGTSNFVTTDPPSGTLDTPLRQDCAFCVDPSQLGSSNPQHCLRE